MKSMRSHYLAATILTLWCAPAVAQTGTITGSVTDAASGAPISEVQVFLVGREIGAIEVFLL